jgi:hypothetical protein
MDGAGIAVKLAVCIPTTHARMTPIRWAVNFRRLEIPCDHYFVLYSGYTIDKSREHLVEDALKTPGTTHLLFWDDDIWTPPEALRLALRWAYPVVSGLYMSRKGQLCAGFFVEGGSQPLPPLKQGQRAFVDYAGLGFCLFDIRVFKRLSRPYFCYGEDMSEDVYLFDKIKRELGIPVLVDADIWLGHETPMEVMPDGTGRYLRAHVPSAKAVEQQ